MKIEVGMNGTPRLARRPHTTFLSLPLPPAERGVESFFCLTSPMRKAELSPSNPLPLGSAFDWHANFEASFSFSHKG